MEERPIAIMLAGPNGAGKTTAAMSMLRRASPGVNYVNADVIAQGLCGGADHAGTITLSGQVDVMMKDRWAQLLKEHEQ